MSLGDFIPTTYTLGSWHSVPHLLTIYPDIRNLLNPGSLPQEFLILLFTWVETYRNSDSTDSFCLLTVPPSLSYFLLHATAIQSPGRTHCSLFSEGKKRHPSQFGLPVSPEPYHFLLTPPTHIQAAHVSPTWLQLVSCLLSFPHPFKVLFLKGKSEYVTSFYKTL